MEEAGPPVPPRPYIWKDEDPPPIGAVPVKVVTQKHYLPRKQNDAQRLRELFLQEGKASTIEELKDKSLFKPIMDEQAFVKHLKELITKLPDEPQLLRLRIKRIGILAFCYFLLIEAGMTVWQGNPDVGSGLALTVIIGLCVFLRLTRTSPISTWQTRSMQFAEVMETPEVPDDLKSVAMQLQQHIKYGSQLSLHWVVMQHCEAKLFGAKATDRPDVANFLVATETHGKKITKTAVFVNEKPDWGIRMKYEPLDGDF